MFRIYDADRMRVSSRIRASTLNVVLLGDRIVLGAINTGRQRDLISNLVGLSIYHFHGAWRAPIGDYQRIASWTKQDFVGSLKSRDAVNSFTGVANQRLQPSCGLRR